MNRKLFVLFLILSILLSGCAWLDGSYVHVTPHQEGGGEDQGEALSADTYSVAVTLCDNAFVFHIEKLILD